MEVMASGTLAAILLIVSIYCIYCKKIFFALTGSIAVAALTCYTGHSWRLMLLSSGKDTAFWGFNRYPAVVILLCVLLISAFVCAIVSAIYIARKQKMSKRANLLK